MIAGLFAIDLFMLGDDLVCSIQAAVTLEIQTESFGFVSVAVYGIWERFACTDSSPFHSAF